MDIVLRIALIFGLTSFCLLILQVILTCRFKPLEKILGLDRLTNFHKNLGILIGCFLTVHVIIMITRIKSDNFAIDMGQWAYGIALVTIIFAFTFGAFGVDYNVWRVSHKTAILIVIIAFVHSYIIGQDLNNISMRILWWFLLAISLSAYLYRNFYIPFFVRKQYLIKSIDPQTHNTYTLTYVPEKGKRFEYIPGQFIFIKFKRPGRKSETHPFSISSSPTQRDVLQNTIKESGNFTNTINSTKTTDKAIIEGPYGRFSFLNTPANALLFIAGGVGITPIMSMIRYMRDTNDKRQVLLIYANRTAEDIIFKEELDNLPGNSKVIHILSQSNENWQGLKGHITKDLIEESAGDILATADIFLCGPPIMMQKMVNILKELKVSSAKIHYERFTI